MEVTQHLQHNLYTNVHYNTFSSLVDHEISVGIEARTHVALIARREVIYYRGGSFTPE